MPDRRSVLQASLAGLAAPYAGGSIAQSAHPLIAGTAHGKVRGADDNGIRVFRGIPYASAQRFMAPVGPRPWSGVRESLAFGPMSPQARGPLGSLFASWTFDKEMSEDCQILNVWTPGLRDGVKRPMMVWLHGGDFTSLSGSRNVFDGTRLCRKGDVVVVTLNHRLNVFGYLQLAELAPAFPNAGNAGMLDIVAALQWVKEHIAEFGGDPGNVTIFGQSGGGGKVGTLMAMPAAQGLFHKAIVQSGSYYLQAMSATEGTRLAVALLAALDMKPADAPALASLPMERLVDGLVKAMRRPARANYRPVVDGRNLPSGPWAPGAPAMSAHIPMIIGTTATELRHRHRQVDARRRVASGRTQDRAECGTRLVVRARLDHAGRWWQVGLAAFARPCDGVRQRGAVGLDGWHRAAGTGGCRSDERRMAGLRACRQSEHAAGPAMADLRSHRAGHDGLRSALARSQRLPRR